MKRTQHKYSLCKLGHSAVRGISSHKASEPSSLDMSVQTGAKESKFQSGHKLAWGPSLSQTNSGRDLLERPQYHVVTPFLIQSWFMSGQRSLMCLHTPRHLLAARVSSVALSSPGGVVNNSSPMTVSPLSSIFWVPPLHPPIVFWVNHSLSMAWQQKHHCSV